VTQALLSLLGAIRDLYGEAPADQDIADVLVGTASLPPPSPGTPDAASLAALAFLPPPGEGVLGRICGLARDAAPAMPWHYSCGTGDRLDARIAFADLVGPGGPYRSDRMRLGLTLVAPETLYPMHAHPARELYGIVSGRALWTAGTTRRRPGPGEFVLHPSGVPHAMQTGAEALLAIYSWSGDIMTPPYYTPAE